MFQPLGKRAISRLSADYGRVVGAEFEMRSNSDGIPEGRIDLATPPLSRNRPHGQLRTEPGINTVPNRN
ncbi:hypothetical protein, partial [Streptomyces sp. PU-14G]|uniref:hypothetical protein n=1 Tax=Streptomyces sp. PU-14G TaxID=2800808 RepID=UPI0034DEA00A